MFDRIYTRNNMDKNNEYLYQVIGRLYTDQTRYQQLIIELKQALSKKDEEIKSLVEKLSVKNGAVTQG